MESLLDSRPSLQELMKQVCLESRWYDIGVLLDLSSEKLDAIRYSSVSETQRTKTSDMYKLWLDSKAEKVTRRELLKVLKNMELNTKAAKYKKYLKKLVVEKKPTPSVPELTPSVPEPIPPTPSVPEPIPPTPSVPEPIPPTPSVPEPIPPTPSVPEPIPPVPEPTPLVPEPIPPVPEPTPLVSEPTIPPKPILLQYLVVGVAIITGIFILLICLPSNSQISSSPQVIEVYGSELRERYLESLTKYKDPKYNKYPTAGPASVHVPFIPLISIVVKNVNKSTAEWLLSTTPNDIIRNEESMKIQIEDILEPVSNKQLKFVLIEGEPGIGKSTLAKELVLRWAKRCDALLNNYDIVFLIQLRFETYHNVNASIEDLFVDLDDQSINVTDLHVEIKKRKGTGILWILDGFDELPDHLKSNSSVLMKLIQGNILSKSTVIVSCRPVASHHLLNFVHEHNSKHISLRGFDSTKIEEYASKYFNDKDKASKFHSYYSDNLVIENMLYNPLHCFIVCTIFNDFIATNNEQYPKTMTSLYNHYVRILLKRHLIDAGLISDPDYEMPQCLMLETDFNNPPLQSVWKNFSLLSEIAYNGTMKQQYIFGKELHNVTKLSMMDTIINFFVFEKDESSSFLHTTLQEYFTAVHLVNNKLNVTIKNYKLQANLQVVLKFYVGICKMTGRELDSTILDIFKQDISRFRYSKYVTIDNALLGCLYEDDSLIYNIGLPINHSLHLRSSIPSTNFDYYIYGYLVALHNITYRITFSYSDQVNAVNRGFQFYSSIKGKMILDYLLGAFGNNRRRVFEELLLMPSDPVIGMTFLPLSSIDFNLENCQIISRFQSLEELKVHSYGLSKCWSLNVSENPLLKLQKLNTLTIGYLSHENEVKALTQLIAPGRPIKILNVIVSTNSSSASHDTFMKIVNIIKMETSLEKLTIREDVTVYYNYEYTSNYIRWTRSTKNLIVSDYEILYYYIEIKNKISTIQLSSFTSLTYIKTNSYMLDKWIPANVTVHSKSTVTFKLKHFIDAFEECMVLLKKLLVKRIHETINIELNINFTCTCDIVKTLDISDIF